MLYRILHPGYAVVTSLLLMLVIALLSGCQALRARPDISYAVGAVAETLSSNVSLSHTTSERSISGSGYLMLRKPDHIRVVILSPFGSVLQEIYVSGELVTIIDAGNGLAFTGSYMDLPDRSDFSAWRYIHWLIDIDPPNPLRSTAVIERINRFGSPEKAVFENGFLISKTTEKGGSVGYSRYTAVQGVAVPLEIKYITAAKEEFSLTFEEPEVNVPFADGAFTPQLDTFRVYPLSSLK